MKITRRNFTLSAASSALASAAAAAANQQPAPKPNILWITCEDIGPQLRACGDEYAVTPNLDKLCARGMVYKNAWSNAPVCAPARTTIISGVYPTSTGSEHMRSDTRMPAGWKMFPGYLRDAGYYCSNNVKEDYNLEKPEGTWDDSSNRAHWRKRANGKPFFSVFNFTVTHESQLRIRPHQWVHDPAKARVPAYHPDTMEVRQDWAQYYDNITTMDGQAGRVLAELEQDGLADDTIVVFFGDHGPGLPRCKRFPYNSGLNVAIVVYFPEKLRHLAPKDYKPGTISSRLVSFVDLAPSMLSLAGIRPPAFYQGQAFLGPLAAPPRRHLFGFRGRMDERYDCVRTVRDERYVYVRNYMPHKIPGQHIDYLWETPTTRVWEKLYQEGKLNAAQRKFWEPKPAEELYDLYTDPDEVNDLANSPAHKAVLEKLRKAHREHELKIRDVGLLPEPEIHSRAGPGGAPYTMGRDPVKYPFERVFAAADLASSLRSGVTPKLVAAMRDPDSAVRYWGAMGVLMRGDPMPGHDARDEVRKLLADPAPSVRIVAAEILGDVELLVGLADAVKNGTFVSALALNALDALGKKAAPVKDRVAALPQKAGDVSNRVQQITGALIRSVLRNAG